MGKGLEKKVYRCTQRDVQYRNTGHIAYCIYWRISPQGFGFNYDPYDLIAEWTDWDGNRVKGIMFGSSRFLADKQIDRILLWFVEFAK